MSLLSNELCAANYVIYKWCNAAWIVTQPINLRADDIVKAISRKTGKPKRVGFRDQKARTAILVLVFDPEYLKHRMKAGFDRGPFIKLTVMGCLAQTKQMRTTKRIE